MAKVTLFTGPNCQRCGFVKRTLDARGVEYIIRDVSEDSEALEHLETNGYKSLPVVEMHDGDFHAVSVGNDIDVLNWIINHVRNRSE